MHLAPVSAPAKPLTTRKGRVHAAPRSLRDRIAQYLHYAALSPNETMAAIAEKMGVGRSHLYTLIKQGQEAGILVFSDPMERIEYQIIPKVVDNLNYFLDAKDKTVTIEAAKGTIFRAYQDSKGITDGGQTILALKIEQADGSELRVLTGRIVGTPKELPEADALEGSIVNEVNS